MNRSCLIHLADAVAAHLNAGQYSQPIVVTRAYRPMFELAYAGSEALVTVIPKSLEVTGASRVDSFFNCAIDVGIQQKVDADDRDVLDSLMRLVEEITDQLRFQMLDAFPSARWLSIENDPVFVPDHLVKERVFTSVLTVRYRLRR